MSGHADAELACMSVVIAQAVFALSACSTCHALTLMMSSTDCACLPCCFEVLATCRSSIWHALLVHDLKFAVFI